MSRRRTEWPEPWVRLKWAPYDEVRLQRLSELKLEGNDGRFIKEMATLDTVTLSQVAYMRRLARRFKVDPPPVENPLKKPKRKYDEDY